MGACCLYFLESHLYSSVMLIRHLGFIEASHMEECSVFDGIIQHTLLVSSSFEFIRSSLMSKFMSSSNVIVGDAMHVLVALYSLSSNSLGLDI